MVERILLVLKVKNLSPSKFADEIGIQRSSMSHIMSGRNMPSLDLVMKIMSKFPDINPEWLVMGNGQMMKSTQIDLFEETSEDVKKIAPLMEALENLPLVEAKNETANIPEPEKATDKPLNNPLAIDNGTQNENILPNISDKIVLSSQPEIEKIVILYKNKSFKEYYPSL